MTMKLASMVIGERYKFVDEVSKQQYRRHNTNNARIADAIEAAGGVFIVESGCSVDGDITFDKGVVVESVETIASLHGNTIQTRGTTVVGESEMKYFTIAEAEFGEGINDEVFKSIRFDKLMAIYRKYNPNVAETKITVPALRKAWDQHVETIVEAEKKIKELQIEVKANREML